MIKVAFLNAFLRSPVFLFPDQQELRLKYILKSTFTRCPELDFLGLCEVWRGFETPLRTEAWQKYKYLSITDTQSTNLFQNSGLMLLYNDKKFVLKSYKFYVFKDAYLLDSLARKGVLLGIFQDRATKENVYILVTHLNDCLNGSISVRKVQYKQLVQLKEIIVRNIPFTARYIAMGDFNIDLRTNSYFPLSYALESIGDIYNYHVPTYMGNIGCVCSRRSVKKSARVYDHIFGRPGTPVHRYCVYNQHYQGVPISDHCLISAELY